MASLQLIGLLLLIAVVFAAVTFALSFIKYKWVKYLPALASLVLGIYMIIMINFAPGEGFQDIARFLLAIMLFAGTLGSAITGFVIDRVFSKRRK